MTQDDQQTANPESTYTQADLSAQADAFGVYPWDIAGIFRQAGKSEMTEADFRRELAAWKGEGQQ